MNFSELSEMVITGQHIAAAEWTQNALDQGVEPIELINKGLVPGMDEIGRRWKEGGIHMPEVLIAARAMKASMALAKPLIAVSGQEMKGTIVIGTVKGDLHDIGKNLVSMMLEGAGFEVHDLGNNVTPEAFVAAAEEHDTDIVAMSALLTTTVPMMEATIAALVAAEVRQNVKVMIGGAPVTQALANQIGADGYADDGASAVGVTKTLLGVD